MIVYTEVCLVDCRILCLSIAGRSYQCQDMISVTFPPAVYQWILTLQSPAHFYLGRTPTQMTSPCVSSPIDHLSIYKQTNTRGQQSPSVSDSTAKLFLSLSSTALCPYVHICFTLCTYNDQLINLCPILLYVINWICIVAWVLVLNF